LSKRGNVGNHGGGLCCGALSIGDSAPKILFDVGQIGLGSAANCDVHFGVRDTRGRGRRDLCDAIFVVDILGAHSIFKWGQRVENII
jgi:hypothetical protein